MNARFHDNDETDDHPSDIWLNDSGKTSIAVPCIDELEKRLRFSA